MDFIIFDVCQDCPPTGSQIYSYLQQIYQKAHSAGWILTTVFFSQVSYFLLFSLIFSHLPSSSCSVLKNFIAASLPPFSTTWIIIVNAGESDKLKLLIKNILKVYFKNVWGWFGFQNFVGKPLAETWKEWTRTCVKDYGWLFIQPMLSYFA